MTSLSQSQFCYAFKQSTGMPPYRWQLAARVSRGQALLTRASVSERLVLGSASVDAEFGENRDDVALGGVERAATLPRAAAKREIFRDCRAGRRRAGFVAIPQTAQQVKERYVDPVRAVVPDRC
jgi:hypothetical protein